MVEIPIYMDGQDDVLYQDELNQALQGSLSNNGWTVPILTTSEIAAVAGDMPNGTIWTDSDTGELKVKLGDMVRVITVT